MPLCTLFEAMRIWDARKARKKNGAEWMIAKGSGDVFGEGYDEHVIHDLQGDIIAYVPNRAIAERIVAALEEE